MTRFLFCLCLIGCMCAFLGLLFASDKNIELYAIRGYAEGKDFECPENLKDIEKYLKETGLKRFSLINKDSLTAQKDSKLTLALPDNLKAEVSVEEVTKEGVVRVHIKIIREKEEKKETVLDTKYPLKEKPLLIGKIKLEEGFLLLALLLK